MPSGAGQDSERFATAVELGVDAVPPGDESLREELEVVALLRSAMSPTADESARMRARVMAAAATMLPASAEDAADGAATDRPSFSEAATLVDTPVVDRDEQRMDPERTNVVSLSAAASKRRGRHRFPTSKAPSPQRRGLLSISAAAALMVLAVTGGGALFSRGALPGDSLYGVKQTTESALVGLTPGQGNKAQRQLDYAATRLDEIKQLNGEQVPATDKSADVSQALQGFDQQTAAGSRMWLASAGSGNSAELGALANWAQTQSQRLSQLRSDMPASAQPDADHSMRLLEDLRTRAQSLSNRQGCDHVTSGDSDQLGPLPAKGACTSKETTSGPTSGTVLPSEPSTTTEKTPDRSGDSDSSTSDQRDRQTSSNKDRSEQNGDQGLLGGLTGGAHSEVGKLPSKESTKGSDVPTTTQTPKPGLNLPLLLPILFQPLSEPGTAAKTSG
jgi:hypothetical protein